MICRTTNSAIFSPESEDGHWPYILPSGQLMLQFGPDRVHASHSAQPESDEESMTSDTSGPSSDVSSMSVALQQSLENKLRQRMDAIGSPLYALTWKRWDMQSGPPICAQRASVRRTSDKDCFGWPTATATDAVKGGQIAPRKNMMGLSETVHQAGYPTHMSRDFRSGKSNQHGKNSRPLNEVAMLVGWATAKASDGMGGLDRNRTNREKTGGPCLRDQALTSGWPTATATDGTRAGTSTIDRKRSSLPQTANGATSNTSHAETENRGQLNPEFVCWLMGYPAEWLNCVDWETLSSRKSRPNLSQRS